MIYNKILCFLHTTPAHPALTGTHGTNVKSERGYGGGGEASKKTEFGKTSERA